MQCKRVTHYEDALTTVVEAAAAWVYAYHTDSPEYLPQHREVYHDHDDCADGKKIEQSTARPAQATRSAARCASGWAKGSVRGR